MNRGQENLWAQLQRPEKMEGEAAQGSGRLVELVGSWLVLPMKTLGERRSKNESKDQGQEDRRQETPKES